MYDINMIGQIIKTARIKNSLSQEKLAELTEITPTHLKHIESGHRKPSVEVLFKLLNTLDISPKELTVETNHNEHTALNSILNKCTEKEVALIEKITRAIIENR